jgi:hypothetical protein
MVRNMISLWRVQCCIVAVVALLLDQHVAHGELNHVSRSLGSDDDGDSQEEVMVSSECAAVLVTEGLIIGGIITSVVCPLLLGALGFTAVGVEAGSNAALWQSTFPLVKAGSLFAKLQSIVMSGAESTVIVRVRVSRRSYRCINGSENVPNN